MSYKFKSTDDFYGQFLMLTSQIMLMNIDMKTWILPSDKIFQRIFCWKKFLSLESILQKMTSCEL
jgi:hypothetical protein